VSAEAAADRPRADANDPPADILIKGADIYTVDAARRWARAVAIRGDRILGVAARDDDLDDLAGPRTRTLHMPGRMIVPGFQDAHIHPAFAGRNMLRVNLENLPSRDAALDRIAAYSSAHPGEGWILGGGWALSLFPGGMPTAAELDRVVADRPAFLMNRDMHTGWVNTKALHAASITRDTPDPWDGRIERDDSGEPTGALHEGAAYSFWENVTPATEREEWKSAIRLAQDHLHVLGITGIQDAWVRPELLHSYRELDDAAELTLRTSASLWWDRHRGTEQIDDFVQQRSWAHGGRVRASTVKIMVDGVVETSTCSLSEPYLGVDGNPTDNHGLSYVSPEDLKEAVTALDSAGFQVHMHAIGDAAVRHSLDAVEAARAANGMNDLRHHIAHVQFVHQDDIPRFRRNSVVANLQALWACHDPQMDVLTIGKVGERRAERLYPFGDLRRSGAVLAMGSDWGVSSADPLLQMEVAVTRTDPEDRAGRPLLPQQSLDLQTALAAFTKGSAYVNHDDNAGSIEQGRRADLAVIDRNLFAAGSGPIGEAKVEMTIASGQIVHGDA
jgi:predicted amidohydrolase YtcJ